MEAPKGGGPDRWGGPKISLFSPLPTQFYFFLPSSGSSSGVRSAGSLKCARLEFSSCHVNRRRSKAASVSHDSPRAQTCTFEGLGLKNTTNIPRADPQDREAGEKQKTEILGGPEEERSGGCRGTYRHHTPNHTTPPHNKHTTHSITHNSTQHRSRLNKPDLFRPETALVKRGHNPEGWGLERWGPKKSRFFSPATTFPHLGSLLVEFRWCFEALGFLKCAHLEFRAVE